jgi:hypothetical protein
MLLLIVFGTSGITLVIMTLARFPARLTVVVAATFAQLVNSPSF